MTPATLYAMAGVGLVGLGLFHLVASADALRRVVAVNVLSTGVASILIASAYRGPGAAADPVPHAFVLTGIVVLVSTTAAALALLRRLHDAENGAESPHDGEGRDE